MKAEHKITNNNIFSKEKINIGRQPEFDYFKTLLIIIMILLHFYCEYSKDCFSLTIDIAGFF